MAALFDELHLRSLVLQNRIAVSPMCQYSAKGGLPTDWHIRHYSERAVGGAGLVMIEATSVLPAGRITPGTSASGTRNTPGFGQNRAGHQGRRGGSGDPIRPRGSQGLDGRALGGWFLAFPGRGRLDHLRPEPDRLRPWLRRAEPLDEAGCPKSSKPSSPRREGRSGGFRPPRAAFGPWLPSSSSSSPLCPIREATSTAAAPRNRMRFPLEVAAAVRAARCPPRCQCLSAFRPPIGSPGGWDLEPRSSTRAG